MMAPFPPNLTDQYEMVVDLLKHEDNLIDLRTNWTLTAQALLFTAFAATLGLFEKFSFVDPTATPVHVGLFVVCGLGLLSCLAGFIGVSAAEKQQIYLREWWDKRLGEGSEQTSGAINGRIKLYPPFYPLAHLKSKRRASKYFLFLAVVWAMIIAAICYSSPLVARESARQSGPVDGQPASPTAARQSSWPTL